MARSVPRSSTPPPRGQAGKASKVVNGSTVLESKKGAAEVMLKKEFEPETISHFEFVRVTCAIVGVYLAALWLLDYTHRLLYGTIIENHDDMTTAVWDHPEPNFTKSMIICEFWSVMTTIPLAGVLLCYQGIRYRLDFPIMAVFVGTAFMYNIACMAHCTLIKPVFQLTLTSVMTNCLSAFWLFGFLATDLAKYVPMLEMLSCVKCRAKVAVVSVAMVIYAAVNLPDYIGRGGGVWTLFFVQAPPVWLASLVALALRFGSSRKELQPAYRMVTTAGFWLSLAMGLSYVECKLSTRALVDDVPVIHITIHVAEQIGIYMYGLSLAFLQHAHVNPRRGVKFGWLFGVVPFFHCEVGSWASKAGVQKS